MGLRATDDLRTHDLCGADVLDTDLHHSHLHNAGRGDHRRRADGLCATGRGDVCAHVRGADLFNASRRNLRATDDFRTDDLCAADVLDTDLHHRTARFRGIHRLRTTRLCSAHQLRAARDIRHGRLRWLCRACLLSKRVTAARIIDFAWAPPSPGSVHLLGRVQIYCYRLR